MAIWLVKRRWLTLIDTYMILTPAHTVMILMRWCTQCDDKLESYSCIPLRHASCLWLHNFTENVTFSKARVKHENLITNPKVCGMLFSIPAYMGTYIYPRVTSQRKQVYNCIKLLTHLWCIYVVQGRGVFGCLDYSASCTNVQYITRHFVLILWPIGCWKYDVRRKEKNKQGWHSASDAQKTTRGEIQWPLRMNWLYCCMDLKVGVAWVRGYWTCTYSILGVYYVYYIKYQC